jgi:hypothetical protein
MESDAIYFARRARDERVAAMAAVHPIARRAHLEMAERYDVLAGAIPARRMASMPTRLARSEASR